MLSKEIDSQTNGDCTELYMSIADDCNGRSEKPAASDFDHWCG